MPAAIYCLSVTVLASEIKTALAPYLGYASRSRELTSPPQFRRNDPQPFSFLSEDGRKQSPAILARDGLKRRFASQRVPPKTWAAKCWRPFFAGGGHHQAAPAPPFASLPNALLSRPLPADCSPHCWGMDTGTLFPKALSPARQNPFGGNPQLRRHQVKHTASLGERCGLTLPRPANVCAFADVFGQLAVEATPCGTLGACVGCTSNQPRRTPTC